MRLTRTAQSEWTDEQHGFRSASDVRAIIRRNSDLMSEHEKELWRIKHFLLGVGLFSMGACWFWQGPRHPHGYGWTYVDGKSVTAHRESYRLFKGPIPEGMCVCHACDTPPCVNPDHLFLGTDADNKLDRTLKDTARIATAHGVHGPVHVAITPDAASTRLFTSYKAV